MANLSWTEVIFFNQKLVILSLPGAAQFLSDFKHWYTLWSVIDMVKFTLSSIEWSNASRTSSIHPTSRYTPTGNKRLGFSFNFKWTIV